MKERKAAFLLTTGLISIFSVLLGIAVSWGFICALYKIVTVLFDLDFNLLRATAAWLALSVFDFIYCYGNIKCRTE